MNRGLLTHCRRLFVWAAAAMVTLIVLSAVLNRFDEPLRVPVTVPSASLPPTEDNGYVWLLGLSTKQASDSYRAGVGTLEALRHGDLDWRKSGESWESSNRWCSREARRRCFDIALDLGQERTRILAETQAFRAQARAIFTAARYDEIYIPLHPNAEFPSFNWLLQAGALDLLEIADDVARNQVDQAIDRFITMFSAHRRVLAGSHSLIGRMVAIALVERDVPFAIRMASSMTESQRLRLLASMRSLSSDERSMTPVLNSEIAWTTNHIVAWPYKKIVYDQTEPTTFERIAEVIGSLFYQPNATANAVAAAMTPQLMLAEADDLSFDARLAEARESTAKRRWVRNWLVNPVGKWFDEPPSDLTDYIARQRDLDSMIAMAAACLGDPDVIDPFTAKPFERNAKGEIVLRPRSRAFGTLVLEGVQVIAPASESKR